MTDLKESDWELLSKELGRKTTESIERWTNFYDKGKVSKRELFIAITMLYESTSGLQTDDVSELIAKLDEHLKAK